MRLLTIAVASLLTFGAMPAGAQDKIDTAAVEAVYSGMFQGADEKWAKTVIQDETQKVCSDFRNDLPTAEFDKVLAREKATVKLPADGNVIGDWKAGEKIAQSGFGGRFNDRPGTINGGNCYACHQITKEEVSYGTLGPSLVEYGKIRNFDPKEAAAAYAKIFNPQSVMPCSNMPRFGHSKFLSEQQIKDVVGLLFAKDSPVNK